MIANRPLDAVRPATILRPLEAPSAPTFSSVRPSLSGRRLPGARTLLSRRTVVPYWLLAVLVAGMLCTTGLIVYSSTQRSAPADVRVIREAVDAPIPAAPDTQSAPNQTSTVQSQLSEITQLRSQVSQVSSSLAQAQHDSAVLHGQTQQQSQDLAQAQSALQTAQQQKQAEIQDLQGRLKMLQQQIDSIQQLANQMRQVVGLPAVSGPTGGPSSVSPPTGGQGSAPDGSSQVRAGINQAMGQVNNLKADLDQINNQAQARLAAAQRAQQEAQQQAQQSAAASSSSIPSSQLAFGSGVPRGWPVTGPITQPFGPTDVVEEPAYGSYAHFHTGIDVAVPQGTQVKATAAGTIVIAGWDGGYGNLVAIDHGHGITTYYGHNSQLLVSVGQQVNAGQVISLSGSTGNSTGPHVHYEVRVNGTPVDPAPYMALGQ